jgi:hypothetical protein
MYRYLLAFWLAATFPHVALAQGQTQAPAADVWARADGRITFTTARISFPEQAGATSLRQSMEFSHHGEGLDNALQYQSDDRQVFGTVYVYYPGLPHAGLTAFATDSAIHTQSGRDLRSLGTRTIAAAGHPNVAIRSDYSGFRNERMASSAAFIKAGRWIVKLRVSGPESRRRDIDRAMSALIEGMRFEGEIAPRQAEPLEVGDCPESAAPAAALLPSDATSSAEEAMIGILDGAGDTGREEAAGHPAATPVLGRAWCLSTRARIGDLEVPILRAASVPGGNERRSVLLALLSDAGTVVEVVRAEANRYAILYHDIGRTRLLGTYSSLPSDQQIVDILSGSDRPGGRIRATIIHKPDGNSEVTINERPTAPRTTT